MSIRIRRGRASFGRLSGVAAVLAATVVVIGCGSAATSPTASTNPSPLAVPTASTGESPTSSEGPSVADAAAGYKAAASAYNKVLDAAKEKLGESTKLSDLRTFYTTVAAAEATFQEALKAIAIPPQFTDERDAMVKAVAVLRARLLRAAKASNSSDMARLSSDVVSAFKEAADAASILRDALGLPPNT